MEQVLFDRPPRGARPGRLVWLIAVLFVLVFVLREGSALAIEYAWWRELGQLETWLGLFTYAYAPLTVATLFAFALLFFTHWRAMRFAGVHREKHTNYLRLMTLGLLILGWLLASGTLENWTVVRYSAAAALWTRPAHFTIRCSISR